jgi:hypothetical protein
LANAYRYSVSLRIWHPSSDPQRFTGQLKMHPRRAWRAGEPRTTPKGTPLPGINKQTYWTSGDLVRGSWPKRSLAEALRRLLMRLTRQKSFFRRIRAKGGRIELFVGWYFLGNSGEVLDTALMKQLQSLGIDLSLDVYPPSQPQSNI